MKRADVQEAARSAVHRAARSTGSPRLLEVDPCQVAELVDVFLDELRSRAGWRFWQRAAVAVVRGLVAGGKELLGCQ